MLSLKLSSHEESGISVALQFFTPLSNFLVLKKKGTKIAYSKIHAFNGTNCAFGFCPSF